MLSIRTDQIWKDNPKYRPNEELPENITLEDVRNTEESESGIYMGTFAHMNRLQTVAYGFLTSAFGAIMAVVAGLIISISSPLWIWATAGSLLASVIGWFGLSRS